MIRYCNVSVYFSVLTNYESNCKFVWITFDSFHRKEAGCFYFICKSETWLNLYITPAALGQLYLSASICYFQGLLYQFIIQGKIYWTCRSLCTECLTQESFSVTTCFHLMQQEVCVVRNTQSAGVQIWVLPLTTLVQQLMTNQWRGQRSCQTWHRTPRS